MIATFAFFFSSSNLLNLYFLGRILLTFQDNYSHRIGSQSETDIEPLYAKIRVFYKIHRNRAIIMCLISN